MPQLHITYSKRARKFLSGRTQKQKQQILEAIENYPKGYEPMKNCELVRFALFQMIKVRYWRLLT